VQREISTETETSY